MVQETHYGLLWYANSLLSTQEHKSNHDAQVSQFLILSSSFLHSLFQFSLVFFFLFFLPFSLPSSSSYFKLFYDVRKLKQLKYRRDLFLSLKNSLKS